MKMEQAASTMVEKNTEKKVYTCVTESRCSTAAVNTTVNQLCSNIINETRAPPYGSTATFSGQGVCGPRSLLLGLRASGRCVMHAHLSCLLWVLPGQPKEAKRGPCGVGRGPVHRQLSRFGLQGRTPASLGSRLRWRIPGEFSVLD